MWGLSDLEKTDRVSGVSGSTHFCRVLSGSSMTDKNRARTPTSFPTPETTPSRATARCDSIISNAYPFPRAMATPPPRKRVSQACRPCGVKKIKVRELPPLLQQ